MPGQQELTILKIENVLDLDKKATPKYTVNQVTPALRQASLDKNEVKTKTFSRIVVPFLNFELFAKIFKLVFS